MSDDQRASIHELQAGEPGSAQRAFGRLTAMAAREPEELAVELSRAVTDERAQGAVCTPRLLTLLGLTRVPSPECLDLARGVLRGLGAPGDVPLDAALGAAAIVALTDPRALVPNIAALQTDPAAAQGIDRNVVAALPVLLAFSTEVLRALSDSAVADMVRRLWHDCAACDLETLADFVGMHAERAGCEDPMVGLLVDLVEQVSAGADAKRYAGQRLQAAGASDAVVERMKLAWRATLVSPEPVVARPAPPSPTDPEPPPPDPRVDESLVMFSEGDERDVEIARVLLEEMLDASPPSAALVHWLAVTVDALPAERRRSDIDWALVQLGTALRRQPGVLPVPPAILQRWLDTPQLLDATGTLITLELLGRPHPDVLVRRYLHRAIAVSDVRHCEIVAGDLWRAITKADPRAVMLIVSRWLAFGFERCEFTDLLVHVLAAECREHPHVIDDLERGLTHTPAAPAGAIEAARTALEQLRKTLREEGEP